MNADTVAGGVETLVRELQQLGFNDYEARAYIALLNLQPATAYEVSKQANLPKANSYTVLESLSRKEAVQPVSESPVRYIAVPPDVLFTSIAEKTRRRCERAKESLAQLATAPQHDYVWSISGRDAVEERIAQMIDEARDHIWMKASDRNLQPYMENLRRAAERGVEVLIVLFGTDIKPFRFGGRTMAWLHEGSGMPVGNSDFLVIMARDFEEALVAETRAQAYGSYTRSLPLVTLAESLIRHEIYFAEIFAVLGEDIQKRFGPALLNLRRKYLPKPQTSELEARLLEYGLVRSKRQTAS